MPSLPLQSDWNLCKIAYPRVSSPFYHRKMSHNNNTLAAEKDNINGELERKSKRNWNEIDENNPSSDSQSSPKRRTMPPREVSFRLIVPPSHIGRVIGKQGIRIQKIREDTKANIKIADAVNREEERVIIINSSCNESEVSDAERALHYIASMILKEEDVGVFITNVGIQHVPANMTRLLITGSQAGVVIGKSGQNIAQSRNFSGARIDILPKCQYPPCASAHESDRVVQIMGGIPEILKALEIMSCQIRENAPSKRDSIRTINLSLDSQNHMFLAQQPSSDYLTSEMTILEPLVGGLIGKSGSNISRIRNESGATIKVSGGRGEQNLRHIYFGGGSQQVAFARKLIDDYIYSQTSYLQRS